MKKLIVLFIILVLSGCGVTDGSDGSDGISGLTGTDGRDYETPVIRDYSWDTTKTAISFNDIIGTDIKLSQVAMNLDNNNNYLLIDVPANNMGKKIQCVINGVVSPEVIVPDNLNNSLVISTLFGTDYAWGKYLSCSRLNHDDNNSYFAWYLDGVMIEYYFVDSFEGYML